MNSDDALLRYVLRLGDNALVGGQRMIERVAGEAELEEELSNANFALDYIGQARMFYSHAGSLEGAGRDEDDFAYCRDSQEFSNFVMVELPNGHFGDSIVRQFLFESFYHLQLESLSACKDRHLAEIAARAEKEIRYHLNYVGQWLIRLGDGTDESHRRVRRSLDELWRYTGEFFAADEVDDTIKSAFNGPDLGTIETTWRDNVATVLQQATLTVPDVASIPGDGRSGLHSEHLGFLIAEMQHLQRAYPGAEW